MKSTLNTIWMVVLVVSATGCARVGNLMNPFQEQPTPEAMLGERNDSALNATQDKTQNARAALEAMASYRRTHLPQPNDPVIQPAVVRLMWIPDHLNKSGDLVPAHYYYVKVLQDRWAVTDAFELEKQLGVGTDASSVPYVYEEDAKSALRGR